MNELVQLLATTQKIEFLRPDKTAKALKESIDRNYLYINFTSTGTELGVELFEEACDYSAANFEEETGSVTITGYLILNYEKVKCEAKIDVKTCEGTGQIIPVADTEYQLL